MGTEILFVIIVMCAIRLYLQNTSFWFVQLFLDDFIILCNIEDTTLDTTLCHNVFWIVLCLGLHEYSSDSNIFKLLKYSNYIHLARMNYYYYMLCSQIEVPEHSYCRLVPY